MYYLGIDPGVSGAWVLLDEDGNIIEVNTFENMKRTFAWRELFSKNNIKACIEKVHSRPGMHATAMGTMMTNFGWWQGVFEAFNIPYTFVMPERWQRAVLDFIPAKEPKNKKHDKKANAARLARNRKKLKQAIVDFAARTVPRCRETFHEKQDIADAFCIALYAKRVG